MSIDSRTVRRMARLSRLELSPSEIERLRRELRSVLRFMDVLAALGLEDLRGTDRPARPRADLREDAERTPLQQAEALREAPTSAGGCFLVPPVLPPRRSGARGGPASVSDAERS